MIPIPHVWAFGEDTSLTKSGDEPLAFIISDHVAAKLLSLQALQNATEQQRRHFFNELIDILVQLRLLEFPAGGSLMPSPGQHSEPIVNGLLTMAANELQRYQSEPRNPGPFHFTKDFMEYLYYILLETSRLPLEDLERAQAQEELFALLDLAKRIPTICNSQSSNGPFILSHLDVRCGNIIIDADFGIAGIIDWEFSGTIPLDYFTPPLWITGHAQNAYINLYTDTVSNEFYTALSVKATTSRDCARLMQEWGSPRQLRFPIVQILRQPETLIRVFYSFIVRKFFTGDCEQLISEFLARNGENRTLEEEIRHRVENSKNYSQYLREHGLQIIDEEAQKRQKEFPANFKVEMAKLNKNYRSTNQTRGCTH
ncbi:phosphotransferase [Pochonia chlamydosporia 170]|uniref:Phosphotransferase n=1 Tax=Pochonia chlamydosporia 170 TaxID=1380566 RepID=A0A179FQQ2_METCM|nr:phosphotransferase [Pochonia chlamydosporia 170]OAQ67946.2 phosphotransferase [Pochonia chlamydosporia 170]